MNLPPQINAENILNTIDTITYVLNTDWQFTYVNKNFVIPESEKPNVLGKTLWKVYPDALHSGFYEKIQECAKTGLPADFELHYNLMNTWYRVQIFPIEDQFLVYFSNITANKKALDIQHFLSKASEVLSSSLDYEVTLANVAKLAVPRIGDWCQIDIVMEDNTLKQLAVAHVEPKKIKLAQKFAEKYPTDPDASRGVNEVIRTGKPELNPFIPDELLVQSAIDAEHLELLRELGIKSYMIIPLIARNRSLGAITLVSSDPSKLYNDADIKVGEELAQRAALAMDNARLYREVQKSKNQLEMAQKAARVASFEMDILTQKSTASPELEALYGLKPNDLQGGLNKWFQCIHPDDRAAVQKAYEQAIGKKGELNIEFREVWPDMTVHWISAIAHNFTNPETNSIILTGINMDITLRKQSEETMRYQAFHDALTKLPNRLLLNDRLQVALQHAQLHGSMLGILFLDLDRFKDINDTLGHSVGDQLLQEVARRLTLSVRAEDTVARFGGDEFLILLPEITDSKDSIILAKKIFQVLKPAVVFDTSEIHLNTSIGIAIYPNDGGTVDTLLKNADAALYRAKESGRNRHQTYTHTMHLQASERLNLENDLRKALNNDELELHYQPIIDLKTGKATRVEALLRWNHPTRGLIMPDQFISLAEETGLILPLGDWVMHRVCKNICERQIQKLPECTVAVNFSARQLSQDNLAEQMEAILAQHQVSPKRIQVEITENSAMENMTVSISKLKKLKELGMHIVVDDFGIGHSSLSYLKRLPIERLKIDKSFIRNCTTDKRDKAIVQAIITMAHTLNLKVCAEGVEVKKQLDFLLEAGCDSAQGFWFSKPIPLKELAVLLTKDKVFFKI